MDFSLTHEHKMMAETGRQIAHKFGPDYWYEKEQNQEYPRDFIAELASAGILGLGIPEQYGGIGLGMTEATITIEAICSGGAGFAAAAFYMLGVLFGGTAVVQHGNEKQKKKYLPKIVSGEMQVCLGVTEPNAGTDTTRIQTFARKEGSHYVINGSKIFITGVEDAGMMILLARTKKREEAENATSGMSLFAVDLPSDAIQCSSIPKLGLQFVKTYELGINDLRVPEENLLGEEGQGWNNVLKTLNPERFITAAGCVGAGKLCVRTAAEYAGERVVFGRPIGVNQGVQHPLARSYAQLDCAWLATLRAASLYDANVSNKEVGDASNIAKYMAVDAAYQAALNAMQAHGGYGYAREYHIERWLRELLLPRVAPINQEMALNYIGEHILGMPKSY